MASTTPSTFAGHGMSVPLLTNIPPQLLCGGNCMMIILANLLTRRLMAEITIRIPDKAIKIAAVVAGTIVLGLVRPQHMVVRRFSSTL